MGLGLHGHTLEGLEVGLGRARTFKEAETSEGVLLGTSAWLITATRR
jgi:hypothetical protein